MATPFILISLSHPPSPYNPLSLLNLYAPNPRWLLRVVRIPEAHEAHGLPLADILHRSDLDLHVVPEGLIGSRFNWLRKEIQREIAEQSIADMMNGGLEGWVSEVEQHGESGVSPG